MKKAGINLDQVVNWFLWAFFIGLGVFILWQLMKRI